MHVEPYLMFGGNCAAAIDFYRTAIGAVVPCVMTFKDSPDPAMVRPGTADQIMHAEMRFGDTIVMASDGCQSEPTFAGFRLTLAAPTAADADRLFAALSAGGSVQMPMAPTFWSPKFGMATDQFGVPWTVMVAPPPAAG